MNTPHRYQYGSLTRRKRIRTEDVWQFRYYETTPEGRRRRRSKIIGVLSEYPTQADALRILERFRLRLNLQNRFGLPVTLDALRMTTSRKSCHCYAMEPSKSTSPA
jgi:hypothetical protein